MPFKGTEQACCTELKAWLETHSRTAKFKAGADPPDADFEVDDERWAVEITELHQYIERDGREISFLGVFQSMRGILRRIRKQAAPELIIGYQVSAEGPFEKADADQIVADSEVHIESGSTDVVELGPDGRFKLIPVTRPFQVGLGGGLSHDVIGGDGKTRHTDPDANIKFTLERILDAKSPKLAALSGYDLKVLLIDSEYIFADPESVIPIVKQCELANTAIDLLFLRYDGHIDLIGDPGSRFNPFLNL